MTKYKFKIRCSRCASCPPPSPLSSSRLTLRLQTSTPLSSETPTRQRSSASPSLPVRPVRVVDYGPTLTLVLSLGLKVLDVDAEKKSKK